MPLLWREAKEVVAKYADRGALCPENKKVDLFLRQVLQFMLYSGTYGNLRKFCFCAVKGCFTLPYELEVPIRVQIDGEVGNVWDRWYEFYNTQNVDDKACLPAGDALFEDPNLYPTVYDLPSSGSRVGVLGTCIEGDTAHIIITGVDTSGREVFTMHEGVKIAGEYLRIRKGDLRYTQTYFSKIVSVVKTVTNGYVQLFWVRPEQNAKGFLSDYSPLEEKPQFRRCRLTSKNCGNFSKVSVIGRIRLKSAYADTDYIPFENIYALQLAAQTVNANFNDNVQLASAKGTMMQDVINKENEFKKVNNGQPIEMARMLSGGSIKNII